MKYLSKEERLNQRIAELEQQIYAKNNIFDKEQGKRAKITFFVLWGAIYLIAFMWGGMNNIKDYLGWLVLSPIAAGLTMYVSILSSHYITTGAMRRIETIAKLEGELNAVKSEKRNNLEDEKIKELERHIEYLENYYANKCDNCTILKLLNEVKQNEQD